MWNVNGILAHCVYIAYIINTYLFGYFIETSVDYVGTKKILDYQDYKWYKPINTYNNFAFLAKI